MLTNSVVGHGLCFEVAASTAIHYLVYVQGIAVIAERVESLPVSGQLAQLGLDYLQGYQMGRPAPLAPLVEQVLRE